MDRSAYKAKIERTAFWALLGIFATIVLGVPAIYYTVHEKRPHVIYEIVNDSEVLDVHQPVKDLQIQYRGEDIYAQKKNLRVLTVTVINDGEVDLRQGDFDQTMPWGFQVTGGQLVDRPKVTGTSSDYIRKNINPEAPTNNMVTFQKIIFEREQSFTIELQILHRLEDEPQLDVLGKIAGIENQPVVKIRKDNSGISFWGKVFYGSISVQIVRLCIFAAGLVLVFLAVLFLIIWVQSTVSGRKERKARRQMDSYLTPLLSENDVAARTLITELFIASKGTLWVLEEALNYLSDAAKAARYTKSFNSRDLNEEQGLPLMLVDQAYTMVDHKGLSSNAEVVQFGRREGLFVYLPGNERKIQLKPGITQALLKLIQFIRINEVPKALQKKLHHLGWWEVLGVSGYELTSWDQSRIQAEAASAG